MARYNFRYIAPAFGVGFALLFFGHGIDRMRDAAKAAGDRAAVHDYLMTALWIDIAAVVCFGFGLVMMMRGSVAGRRKNAPSAQPQTQKRSSAGAGEFDTDATPPARGGFGRKTS